MDSWKFKINFPFILKIVFLVVLLCPASLSLGAERKEPASMENSGNLPSAITELGNVSNSREETGNEDLGPVGIKLFDEVMRLIQNHYVSNYPKKHILKETISKLVFSLEPLCAERTPRFDECSGTPESCFAEIIRTISRRCRIKEQQVTQVALEIILRNLDQYSSILDPRMINELKISAEGRFGGIGMVVSAQNGSYVVISSVEGSPAHEAAIGPGDIVISIDGKPLQGLPLHEALGLVRGPSGSLIKMKVQNHLTGEIRNLEMRRKIIQAPPVKYTILNHGIGYIRIINFQTNTRAEVEKALKSLVHNSGGSLSGLILDLRDNPGGLFTEAIRVAELFVKAGVITSLQGKDRRFSRVFSVTRDGPFSGIRLVALINKGSASASEVLTGALLANPNVLVMGERSFGKASVQNVFPLSGAMALRLTTAHYFTSDGRDIEGKGLEPDIPLTYHNISDQDKTKNADISEVLKDPEVKTAMNRLLSPIFPIQLVFNNLF